LIRLRSREKVMESYKKLSELLSLASKKIEKDNLGDVEFREIRKLAKAIGGTVLERYEILEEDISKKLDKKILLEDCQNLKNELFEL
jgi:hypothetical protein